MVPIENIYDIVNENDKNKVNSVPSLAFKCTIAQLRSATDGKLESKWSDEANDIFYSYVEYPKKISGTVSQIINFTFKY